MQPTSSDPGGKSNSIRGSPPPLMLAKTACRKCHRRSWSGGLSWSSKDFSIHFPDRFLEESLVKKISCNRPEVIISRCPCKKNSAHIHQG